MDQQTANLRPPKNRLSFPELAAFTAAAMALNALAIDIMLPALGVIGDDLNAPTDNSRQLVVGVFLIGNGIAQLFFGPIVDRFGRRRVLLFSLVGYILASLLSVVASSFALLLAARTLQGAMTAAARVSAIASVRDQVSGRRMAEVMSFAITILMAAPILAPLLGQLVLFVAPWRGIMIVLFLYGVIILIWSWMRLPETLPEENRQALNLRKILSAYREFVTNRVSIGYTLCSAVSFAALFALINASEQVFLDTFGFEEQSALTFPFAFAMMAISFAIASLLNARLVSRYGMRRLTHLAIVAFVVSGFAHLLLNMAIGDNLFVFMALTCAIFFCIGLIGPNCSALAMEPMGHIAGAAAAANGFAGTTVAGVIGSLIGQMYDGTTTPIVTGFFVMSIAAFVFAFLTEKGRLFEPGNAS